LILHFHFYHFLYHFDNIHLYADLSFDFSVAAQFYLPEHDNEK